MLKELTIILMNLLFRFPLNRLAKHKLKLWAEESQKRRYPDDFVLNYVEGDGKTFDFGIDYTECAICKFWRKQGAEEMLPYICLVDFLSSELITKTGLVRSMTLAEGFERCDFRFKRDRKPMNKQKTQFPNLSGIKKIKDRR